MIKKLLAALINIFLVLVLPVAAFAGNATLSLSPSTGTFNKGCTYSIDVLLDTGGANTDGTDAIIKYDPTIFDINSQIKQGTIYSDYPGNNVNTTSGVITISGLASVSSPFSGKGTLGTFTLTIKSTAQTGLTQMTFDFDPNNKTKTSDSNVVERGTVADVLNSVVNGSYTIGTGSCAGGTTNPPATLPGTGYQGATYTGTPSGQVQYQPPPFKNLDQAVGGKTGTTELTATIAIVGSVLTVLGILGLVLL